MRAFVSSIVGICVLLAMSGCGGLNGTWKEDTSAGSKSPIATVSFCADGTFTAEAEYGANTTRAISGYYKTADGKLMLDMDGHSREYGYQVNGDSLTMTYKDITATMRRMKPRG